MKIRYRPSRDGKPGYIDTPGVDFGPVQVREVFRDGSYAVWHVPGSTQWSGRGQTAYYATYFQVVRVIEDPRKDTTGWVTGLVDEVGSVTVVDGKWRVARQQAIDIAREKATQERIDAR